MLAVHVLLACNPSPRKMRHINNHGSCQNNQIWAKQTIPRTGSKWALELTFDSSSEQLEESQHSKLRPWREFISCKVPQWCFSWRGRGQNPLSAQEVLVQWCVRAMWGLGMAKIKACRKLGRWVTRDPAVRLSLKWYNGLSFECSCMRL